jgi:hypothetical protein
MLGDVVAQVLELALAQRVDEPPGLAPDRLVRQGEADTKGEWINAGMAISVADVPSDRSDSAR